MNKTFKLKINGESPRSLILAFVLSKLNCDVYVYNFLSNTGSKEDYQILKDFPRLDSGYENITGFRDAIDNRVYLNDKFVNDNPQFKNILRTLIDTDTFEKIFN